MSSSVTDPSTTNNNPVSPASKGKGKRKMNTDETQEEVEDEEEDDDDDDEIMSEDEDEEAEESFEGIDPSDILPGRRTRGVKVDYTSKEALEKAGLQDQEEEDSDDDVAMKD